MRPQPGRLFCLGLLGLALPFAVAIAEEPAVAKPPPPGAEQPSLGARIVQELLPLAWQKRPLMHFNAITEMTEEGRRRTPPTAEQPLYYVSNEPKFVQTGWSVAAGEHPPPVTEVEGAMKTVLANNHYLPVSEPNHRPDLLIILSYGSHGTDPASEADTDDVPPTNAIELMPLVLHNPALFRDVIDRATLIGGEKFARGLKAAFDGEINNMNTNRSMRAYVLPVIPDANSPYGLFVRGTNSSLVEQLAEQAFHTCYFVVAVAYDFAGAENRQKILLWRTKMTVEAQGVAMDEVLRPLITSTGAFLGRDMSEATIVKKRIDREGHVELGTPTVVHDQATGSPPDQAKDPK